MDINSILPIVSIILTVFGFSYQHFRVIGDLKERIAKVETKTDLFWKVVETHITDIVKSTVNYRKDDLLDGMKCGQLNSEEMVELRSILEEEFHTKKDQYNLQRVLLIARLDQLTYGNQRDIVRKVR